jgi:hypothetical protein
MQHAKDFENELNEGFTGKILAIVSAKSPTTE